MFAFGGRWQRNAPKFVLNTFASLQIAAVNTVKAVIKAVHLVPIRDSTCLDKEDAIYTFEDNDIIEFSGAELHQRHAILLEVDSIEDISVDDNGAMNTIPGDSSTHVYPNCANGISHVFNGDVSSHLIIFTQGGESFSILFELRKTFVSSGLLDIASSQFTAIPDSIALIDCDNDGYEDVIITRNGQQELCRNGGFDMATFDCVDMSGTDGGVAIGDFNNDGWPDIAHNAIGVGPEILVNPGAVGATCDLAMWTAVPLSSTLETSNYFLCETSRQAH